MIIFTFETATIEPIDRLSLFPISSPPLPLVPPPPRQWILIIRPVYKAEHSPINQRVTTRLIARNTRPLIAAIYSSYRPIQIHSRGATPFNPPRRASRCAKLPYRLCPPSLSLSLFKFIVLSPSILPRVACFTSRPTLSHIRECLRMDCVRLYRSPTSSICVFIFEFCHRIARKFLGFCCKRWMDI